MNDRPNDIDCAADGTCEWLLRHKTYRDWMSANRGLLWLKGKPGSGKSTLLKYALRRAQATHDGGTLFLAFFFHGRGDELQKTPEGLFRSLLHQALGLAPDALPDLVETFEKRRKEIGEPGEKWKWRQAELRLFFESSLPKVLKNRPVWLFIDALDECGEKNAVDLVDEFKSLLQRLPHTDFQFRICFTCRHYPILNLDYGWEICIDHENTQDISAYVQAQLSSWTALIQATIRAAIVTRASGVFMWELVIERVRGLEHRGESWKKIEAEINAIPPDIDDLYRELV